MWDTLYNAEVLEVCGPAIQVRFRDYGNLAEVDEQFVLPRVEEIPEDDLLANIVQRNQGFWRGTGTQNFSKPNSYSL